MDDAKGCIAAACGCFHAGLTKTCIVGCKGGGEFLCCEGYGCCATDTDCLETVCCATAPEGENWGIRCTLPWCLFGLKSPSSEKCYNSRVECCWGFGVGSCPPQDGNYQKVYICALCFYTCSKAQGKPGCCAPAPERTDEHWPEKLPTKGKEKGTSGVQFMER